MVSIEGVAKHINKLIMKTLSAFWFGPTKIPNLKRRYD